MIQILFFQVIDKHITSNKQETLCKFTIQEQNLCYLNLYKYCKMTKQKVPKEQSQVKNQKTGSTVRKNKNSHIKTISKDRLRSFISSRFTKETIIRKKQMFQKLTQKSQNDKVDWEVIASLMQRENLNCPICLDYCIYPVLTECGHYYCLHCFENAHKRSQHCCVCRGPINITDYQPSSQLQQLFQEFMRQKVDWSQTVLYQARVEEAIKRQTKRKISSVLQIGDKIDYKFLRAWVEAKITSIEDSIVQVQYENLFTRELQKVKVNKNSRLLAAYHSFSIPREIRKQGQRQPIQRIQIPVRRQVRRPFRIEQAVPLGIMGENNQQTTSRQNTEDDRDWQNMVSFENRGSGIWFDQQIQINHIWTDLIPEIQPEDNDWILTF